MFSRKKIEEILVNEFSVSREVINDLKDDTDLLESGIIDSFDFVNLLMILSEMSGKDFDFSVTPPDSLTSIAKLTSIKFDNDV
jgi:acyl carrier protein